LRVQPHPEVRITGTGTFVPERVVSNKVLEGMVKGFDASRSGDFGEWVDQVTHIHERRFCDYKTRSSDLALPAARQALAEAGIEARDLGLIVYASFTMSQQIPGDHCLLAEDLGAVDCPTFHLMGACSGSVYGLGLAYGMIASGVYEHVLVVGTETISKALNFHDPLTAIIFGDGAGAAVVSRRKGAPGTGMLPPQLGFKYSPRNIHLGNSNIPVEMARFPDREVTPGVQVVEQALVEMEGGPSVLRSAVQQMAVCTAKCLGYDEKDLRKGEPALMQALAASRVVPHQANGRIVDGMADKLGVAPERVTRTVYVYGNTSAASNLIALDHARKHGNLARRLSPEGKVLEIVRQPEHTIQPGELVLLPSIGGGYLMGCVGYLA
jgi:3-oxoacyl-[acyl-carrier-protein] synthase-3